MGVFFSGSLILPLLACRNRPYFSLLPQTGFPSTLYAEQGIDAPTKQSLGFTDACMTPLEGTPNLPSPFGHRTLYAPTVRTTNTMSTFVAVEMKTIPTLINCIPFPVLHLPLFATVRAEIQNLEYIIGH